MEMIIFFIGIGAMATMMLLGMILDNGNTIGIHDEYREHF